MRSKINKLTPVKPTGRNKYNKKMFLFKCDCGSYKEISMTLVTCGRIKDCGCKKIEDLIKRSTKHNKCHTEEYKIYYNIKTRLFNKKRKSYKDYGKRGISMSQDWLNSFENFLRDMGKRPSARHSIERVDNSGDYCKENCKWVTVDIQANNKRNNLLIEHNGEIKTVTQWCKIYSLNFETIRRRFHEGLKSPEIFYKYGKPVKLVNYETAEIK